MVCSPLNQVNTVNQTEPKSLMAERFRGFLPVVIDVETGGFKAETDALLELAAVTIGMDDQGYVFGEHREAGHITPFDGANIEQSAIDFIGIDPFHPLRVAYAESDVLDSVFKMVRKAVKRYGCTRAVLVGHNAHFDLNFLNAAAARCNTKRNPFHPFSCFDTATLAGLAYGQTVLSRACTVAGIEFDDKEAHSARYDTDRTAELFCSVVNRWKELGGWPE